MSKPEATSAAPNSITCAIAWVKQPAELKKRQLSQKQLKQHNTALGQAGEERAVQFLKSQNYRILERNVRVKTHEVDIVAFDTAAQELVFVEVKTRTSALFGDPSLAVTARKMRSMQRVAQVYCKRHAVSTPYRFDVIAVLPQQVEHFKNVTW